VQHAFGDVARVLATHHSADQRVSGTGFLDLRRSVLEVHRDGGREHLDMADLLRGGIEEHVTIFGRGGTVAPSLKEILETDADFTFDPADRLLKHAGVDRVRALDPDRILQALVVEIHRRASLPNGERDTLTGGIGPATAVRGGPPFPANRRSFEKFPRYTAL
jgi:hypothetical protein